MTAHTAPHSAAQRSAAWCERLGPTLGGSLPRAASQPQAASAPVQIAALRSPVCWLLQKERARRCGVAPTLIAPTCNSTRERAGCHTLKTIAGPSLPLLKNNGKRNVQRQRRRQRQQRGGAGQRSGRRRACAWMAEVPPGSILMRRWEAYGSPSADVRCAHNRKAGSPENVWAGYQARLPASHQGCARRSTEQPPASGLSAMGLRLPPPFRRPGPASPAPHLPAWRPPGARPVAAASRRARPGAAPAPRPSRRLLGRRICGGAGWGRWCPWT